MKIKLGKLLLSIVIAASLSTLYADGFAIDSNKFRTSPFDDGFLTVYGASGLEDGLLGIGFIMNYQHKPILLSNSDGSHRSVVRNQLTADLSFFYSFVKWFDLGVSLPVVLFQNGDGWNSSSDSITAGGVGDLRLVPRFQLFSLKDELVAMSVVTEVSAPTGKQIDAVLGSRQFTFRPAIAIGSASKWVDFSANLYYHLLPKQTFGVSKFDDEFGLDLGLNVHAMEKLLDVNAEFRSATSIADPFDNKAVDYIEFGGGVRVKTPVNIDVVAGAFGGFGSAVGIPKFRLYAGFTWNMSAPIPKKTDKDVQNSVSAGEKQEVKKQDNASQKKQVVNLESDKKQAPTPEQKAAAQSETKTLPAPPEKTGEKLQVVVRFMHNSDYIKDPVDIEKIALILTNNFTLKIRIESHIDKHESADMSMKRAQAVKAILVKSGIEAKRIIIKNIGAKEPVSTDDSELEKAKNRRVEFFIVQ